MDMQLKDLLNPENILFDMAVEQRDDALSLLVQHLHRTVDGFDPKEALQSLKEREKLLPTVIAPGVALPHARLQHMSRPLVAVGTTRKGIVFDSGRDPVNLVLLVLTPEADPSSYLRLLSMISTALKDVKVKDAVGRAAGAKDIAALFSSGAKGQKDYLTAADFMNREPVTLKEGDTLHTAIKTLCSRWLLDIPVVDEQGDLRGVVRMEDLLSQSLPQHLLWMEDLTPILRFQPFAEMMKKDQETKLADFMHEDYVSVSPSTPAVQLAKLFLMKSTRQIQVLEGRRLAGVVSLSGFTSKLFWE